MKKTFALILAAMMLLGAVKGMADEVGSIENEITIGKIDAADLDLTTREISQQINELNAIQDSLAQVEDSGGLIRDIGQTVTTAEMELKGIDRSMDLDKAHQLKRELSEVIATVKAHLPK
ncbi:hypothetical protein [Bdellovibrio svalbardensis]|uniref:Uncharacterized protein n=1 Tax=Bdellovibrio svalbardensis TaxID=2972972 RepID=A0ABT6DMQ1_9BACT|nr:hypothetical protein [Bdellovibrio svalbardensis]MDG0817096.1 hypothetical protein [Bdellovibrio svalbardensis]